MRPSTRYDEPFFWWGPGWQERPDRPLADLLRNGTIDPEQAALIWAALARRRSLAVIAGPSGAGKTTLLTALCAMLPEGMRRLYLRGGFETFAFLDDPAIAPGDAALLINEISPHLPVYLWGPAVRRALAARATGYMLLATAHAESAAQFVSMLAGSPLRIPVAEVAAFDLVALLERTGDVESGRRVAGVWGLTPSRDGVVIEEWSVGICTAGDISHEPPTAFSPNRHPFPLAEIARRVQLLTDLRGGQIAKLPDGIAPV